MNDQLVRQDGWSQRRTFKNDVGNVNESERERERWAGCRQAHTQQDIKRHAKTAILRSSHVEHQKKAKEGRVYTSTTHAIST